MNEVIIAGAGPNGLMLACELALDGVRPVVLDPLDGPNPEPRANGMAGQVVSMLDRRGLYERLADSPGPPCPAQQFMFAAFPLDLTGLADNPIYLLMVPQIVIVQVLAQRAAELGVDIRWGHTLTNFTQQPGRVDVTAEGPQGPLGLTARFLVGADGGHSPVRKLASIDFEGVSTDNTVSRIAHARVPDDWIDAATGALDVPGFGRVSPYRHLRTEHGLFVWAPFLWVAPAVTTIEWNNPADDDVPMTLDEMAASARRVLAAELPLRPPTGAGPFSMRRILGGNSRLASRFRDGRVLLLGDAAHVHSAIGGPGLNLGLQDAMNLGWKLAHVIHGRVEPALLDTYEAERRPVSQRVLMHTRAQSALIAPGAEVTALRELFAELLTDTHVVKHIADLLAGAEIRYAADPHAHLLVGRWAPDLTVVNHNGSQRLAELARDGRPLLIDLTGGALASRVTTTAHRIAVITGHPRDDAPATALLVRPDGYVAWATSETPPDAAGLDQAAHRWFGTTLIGGEKAVSRPAVRRLKA
ncbi:MAG TPA: FAD-dependent monooxygenase [Mycobacterium sp.]|nr:FAD-dependent monooxygenase [Mycobacterium sp.]